MENKRKQQVNIVTDTTDFERLFGKDVDKERYIGSELGRVITEFSGRAFAIVNDLFLFKRFDEPIEGKMDYIKKQLLLNITYLNGKEWDKINDELKEIQRIYNDDNIAFYNPEIIRAVEGMSLISETVMLLVNNNIDLTQSANYFRKKLEEEPDRKDIISILLQSLVLNIKN